MKGKCRILRFIPLFGALVIFGCAPKSFVRSNPDWKAIELRDSLRNDCDKALQTTLDTIARSWDIKMTYKDNGYLRTDWAYGISGGEYYRYRGRITIRYPQEQRCERLEVKTEAQWLEDEAHGNWVSGFDIAFDRDVYDALSSRLGRTIYKK